MSEVNGFNELIENAAHELRRPVRFNPALDERVMKSVRAIPRFGRMANLVGWLLTTHPVRLSPAFGLVVLVGAAVGMWAWASSGAVPEQIASSFETGARMIGFSLVVPEADAVAEAGRLVQRLPELWAAADLAERRRLLLTVLDAVYVDAREARAVVSIRPKAAFDVLLERLQPAVLTTG